MAEYRYLHQVATVCLVLNGIALTTLCVGWKVEGIQFERNLYLLGCMIGAATLSLVRLLIACADRSRGSQGGRHSPWIFNGLEVIVLSVIMALLLTPEAARECMVGEGPTNFCRLVVRDNQSRSLNSFNDLNRLLSQWPPVCHFC